MGPTDRFASRVRGLEEVPKPTRTALLKRLSPRDQIPFMVYGPMTKNVSYRSPATLLAVTRKGWIVVTETSDGPIVNESDFANTLLIELTHILLFGRLRIDYAADGRTASVGMEYNTVMGGLYREGLQLLLDGIEGSLPDLHFDQERVAPLLAHSQ